MPKPNRRNLTVIITNDQNEALRDWARKEERSISFIARKILQRAIDQHIVETQQPKAIAIK